MVWRVLVSDDDPAIRTLIETILRSAAFDVHVCGDAEEALVRLECDEPYDILISDFMFPGISGIELIATVRANPRTSKVPILMISGHGSHAIDGRATAAGADRFLAKPFTSAQLRSAVTALSSKCRRRPPHQRTCVESKKKKAQRTA